MLAQILPKRFIPLVLALILVASTNSYALAQDRRPEVEVDTSVLDDLGPPRSVPPVTLIKPGREISGRVLTVPSEPPIEEAEQPFIPIRIVPPGTVSHPPEETAKTPVLTPQPEPKPAAAPKQQASKPVTIVKAPVPAQKPEPKIKAVSIQKFPITEKMRTDSINPAAPETAPAPAPDIAAALSPAVPPPAKMPPAAPSHTKTSSASVIAAKSPRVAMKPVKSGLKPKQKNVVTKVIAPAQVKLSKSQTMPAVPSVPVSTAALPDDKLARNLETPDRHKLAQDIEIKSAKTQKPVAARAASKPVEAPKVNSDIVHTPAENVNAPSAQAANIAPDSKRPPRPPPSNPKEMNFFTAPFTAGGDTLDAKVTAVLQAQVLPLLKDHPSWKLQIQSFASPTNNEPISARKVSLARALAVRSWLLDKGVEPRRMEVRALGLETDRDPIDRVDMVLIDPEAIGG